jgi:uncharacterized membrane protein
MTKRSFTHWRRLATTYVVACAFYLFAFSFSSAALAQGQATNADPVATPVYTTHQAVITQLVKEESGTYPDGTQTVKQDFLLKLESGPEVPVTIERLTQDNKAIYSVGDRVVVNQEAGPDGQDFYYIADFVRTPALGMIFGLFVLLVIGISGWHGVRSLAGLASSFVIIFTFILPNIERGYHPVFIAVVGSFFIMLVTFYLSHGFHRKTTLAVAGTLISLVTTGLLSLICIELAKLTGFATEEAVFLQVTKGNAFNAQGLLLAGIIIGTLGVLDDITLSQASVVQELLHANPKLSSRDLFLKAMNVGKDHIASLVNTLVLVYTGSALPLLLLFQDSRVSTLNLLNYEIIAEEIVKTLVGSSGLILAVPVTTLLAVMSRNSLANQKEHQITHSHKH